MNIDKRLYAQLLKYNEGGRFTYKDNKPPRNYKPYVFTASQKNLNAFNKLYNMFYNSGLRKIVRTPKKYISKNALSNGRGCWDLQFVTTKEDGQGALRGVILTAILFGRIFIIKAGSFGVKSNLNLTGKQAFNWWRYYLKKENIDINKYAVDNGSEVKAQIQSPMIDMQILYTKLQHVNHLDLNSAWPSQVAKAHPELKNSLQTLYNKKGKFYPSVALGYCQSKYCNYRWANLAKEGINGTNKVIKSLCTKLRFQDFEIVGINTDGIWYMDAKKENRLYHDENEGKGFGKWKHDHIDCEFMAYSSGQYWYRENGKFTPVARGSYGYELLKPRDQWDEHDFDKAMYTMIQIIWTDGIGFELGGKLDEETKTE